MLVRNISVERLTNAIFAATVIVAIYFLSAAIYNVWFHPLSHFPGPYLARVSKLWARIGNFYGQKSERIRQAHRKYGSVVRVGPNELSFDDRRAPRDIYTSDLFIKEETFYRAKTIFHEDHLMSFRNPQAHKQRRKLLRRGYSQAAMIEFEPKMSTKIQTMLDHWAARCTRDSIDVFAWSHWLAFDIVYHLLFDEDPGSVTAGRPPKFTPYIRAWRPTFIYKEFFPRLQWWGPYVPGYIGAYFRKVREWKGLAVEIIRECRKRETTSPFLRPILQGQKDEFLDRELTDGEIAEECMGGMFGGSGTTANTFVYLLWACAKNPQVVKKLRAELDKAFPHERRSPPAYLHCASLPYLDAVISETLRLYPTIPATLPRTATSTTTVADIVVPAGTIVGTQNHSLHRDPQAFPQPQRFTPERWHDPTLSHLREQSYNPFSLGPRSCVGINLARMELCKMTAAFFLRFEAELDPTMTDDDMRMYDVFSASPAGGKLLLRLRER